jgi:hypothetical protein
VAVRPPFSWFICQFEDVLVSPKSGEVHVQSESQKFFLLILCVRYLSLSQQESRKFMQVCRSVKSEFRGVCTTVLRLVFSVFAFPKLLTFFLHVSHIPVLNVVHIL